MQPRVLERELAAAAARARRRGGGVLLDRDRARVELVELGPAIAIMNCMNASPSFKLDVRWSDIYIYRRSFEKNAERRGTERHRARAAVALLQQGDLEERSSRDPKQ